MSNGSRIFIRCATFALPIVALGIHSWYYYPFIADDAFVSLRYAQRLIHGHGLTWTDGIRVEGYSNLLWILLTASIGALGIDLIVAVRILGALCTGAVFAAVWYRHHHSQQQIGAFLIAAFSIACSASIAVWTVGGLEQPLIAALLAWVVVLCFNILDAPAPRVQPALMAGVLLGCISITRPDGGIFIVTVAVALWFGLHRSVQRSRIVYAVVVPAFCFVCAQLAFRLWYYGEWVPNTALVKLAFSAHYAYVGAKQVLKGLLFLTPVFAIATMLGSRLRKLSTKEESGDFRNKMLVPGLAIVTWLGYVGLAGGDIFPATRPFVPVVVLVALGISEFYARSVVTRKMKLLMSGLLILFLCSQFLYRENRKAASERWEWDGRDVGGMLKHRFGESAPLLAVQAAGALPYWSELPCLDLFGLNDYYLPRHRPVSFGYGAPSHELYDADYVFARAPDFIIFNTPKGTLIDDSSRERLLNDFRFHLQYTNIVFTTMDDSLLSSVWVRNTSTKVNLEALKRERNGAGHVRCIVPK